MNKRFIQIIAVLAVLCFSSCKQESKNQKFTVVTTTTMITDLVKNIGGDSIQINGLMGAGIDPHLYKASEGDVQKLSSADAIFYNGLHLEGKMVEIFEKMKHSGKNTFAISDGLPKERLISSANFPGNHDPHIWFSVQNWIDAAHYVNLKLAESQPQNKNYFNKNTQELIAQLEQLQKQLKTKAQTLDPDKRILVTAHDAFEYFGKEFDFEVVGLQGISTASEAGTRDVLDLANFIVEKKIPAIFVESSVPKQTVLALQKAVENKGGTVALGGMLYSDALGAADKPEGTYIGMFNYNMNTIVNALKNE